MKTLFFLVAGLLIAFSGYAQERSSDCHCPSNTFTDTKAIQSFRFAKGKEIIVCGYEVENSRDSLILSEFVLSECGADDLIDFWDAMTVARLSFDGDTLLLEELYTLPTGPHFGNQDVAWTQEQLYYGDANQLQRKKQLNRQIPNYSEAQIREVLSTYASANDELDEEKMDILNRLFVATLSGSDAANALFRQFGEQHPGLDGAYAYQYRILGEMLLAWQE